jgi:hypothetical protein
MNNSDSDKGNGVAHDGRHFCPTIPAGATVSWKRLPENVEIRDADATATHVLAVWDRFEEMGINQDELRETPRGACVVYLADAEAIEYLIDSPVPAPSWLDEAGSTGDHVLAHSLALIRQGWRSPQAGAAGPSTTLEMAWLRSAVVTHYGVTGKWPIVEINVPKVLSDEPFPAERIRNEADRLFDLVRDALSAAPGSCRGADMHSRDM